MFSQLLDIKIIPMEYQLQITSAKLEANPEARPDTALQTTIAAAGSGIAPASAADAYQSSRSSGNNSGDAGAQNGGSSGTGQKQSYTAMGQQQTAKSDGSVTIPESVRQKMFDTESGSTLYTAFLPDGGAGVSWQPGSAAALDSAQAETQQSTTQQAGELTEFPPEPQYNYIPGEVHLEILQQARVEIEYLGGPRYFPPPSDPALTGQEKAG